MSEIIPARDEPQPSVTPTPTFRNRAVSEARKYVAVLTWIYLVTKIFIFDIDSYVVRKYFPNLQWILDYKFLIFIGIIGLVAFLFNKWQVLVFIGYVLFYPLLIILWILPYAIFKSGSWMVAIAIINSVIRFFADFEITAIMAGVFVISALAIIIADQAYISIFSTACMVIFVVAMYILAVLAVFRPDPAFRVYSKMFTATKNHTMKNTALGELAVIPISNFSEKQLELRKTNLEIAVLTNRFFLFVAKKFRSYQLSKLSLIAGIFKCLWIVAVCTIAFSCINYGIFKIDNTQFNPSILPSAFILLYYSFKTFISNTVIDLSPVKIWSELSSVAENICGFFTISIFVGTLLSQRNARQTREIDEAVIQIERDAETMERFVRSEFRIENIDEAISELGRLKGGMLGIVLWLTKSIK